MGGGGGLHAQLKTDKYCNYIGVFKSSNTFLLNTAVKSGYLRYRSLPVNSVHSCSELFYYPQRMKPLQILHFFKCKTSLIFCSVPNLKKNNTFYTRLTLAITLIDTFGHFSGISLYCCIPACTIH